MAALARTTIEKINGKARTVASNFFIGLTSHKIFYNRAKALGFFALSDAGASREVAFFWWGLRLPARSATCCEHTSSPHLLRRFWVCGGALGNLRSRDRARG